MAGVSRIGDIGAIVDEIIRLYSEGKLKAIAVAVKEHEADKEDTMNFYWDGFGTYAEQLGACDMIKESMFERVINS